MGYDFIAISHVLPCELPNNATPFAECMYRDAEETYYECIHNNATVYCKAANNSHTTHWSINIGGAADLQDTLRNQGVDVSELFTGVSHTAAALRPLLASLRNVDTTHMDQRMSSTIGQLIRILDVACDDGILLNV
jgi:hypothetical protein